MAQGRPVVAAAVAAPLAIAALGLLASVHSQTAGPRDFEAPAADFHFLRLEYEDRADSRRWWGAGWWLQDWPEADVHFNQGLTRLTRIDAGEPRHLPLTDDRIFDYPWVYATQVGYWDLSDAETERLREYLLRGGFLVVDDFYGPRQWEIFRVTMERVFPDQPIVAIEDDDPVLHVLYDIEERTTIPGLRHLRRAPGGRIVVVPEAGPPQWRAIYDPKGRMVVAINFNMDVGDAWEHADMPEYPEAMTSLAYRFGINYIIYAMTH
jgi:hypothetical protein